MTAPGGELAAATTDAFHDYRIAVRRQRLRVWMDEALVFQRRLPRGGGGPAGILFGDGSGVRGTATLSHWDYLRYDVAPGGAAPARLQALTSDVRSIATLTAAHRRALTRALYQARDQAFADRYATACGQVATFTALVAALAGNELAQADADRLTAAAAHAGAPLGC